MTSRSGTELQRIIDAALRGELDQATAERVHSFGREAVVLFALALTRRLAAMGMEEPDDAEARRLAHRLSKHAEHLFTFLDSAHVPFENNFAERQIRPAVVLRKDSQCNRPDRGAATQAILMTTYQTLHLRDLNPADTVTKTLRNCVATNKLDPLASSDIAGG